MIKRYVAECTASWTDKYRVGGNYILSTAYHEFDLQYNPMKQELYYSPDGPILAIFKIKEETNVY